MSDEEPKKRRSRVLEYYEKKQAEEAEAKESGEGDDDPFRDLDSELGLDGIETELI